jgi:hypothetical protein
MTATDKDAYICSTMGTKSPESGAVPSEAANAYLLLKPAEICLLGRAWVCGASAVYSEFTESLAILIVAYLNECIEGGSFGVLIGSAS